MKKIFFVLILYCSSSYSQNKISKINASITTNTKEIGIKYSEAEQILKTSTPNYQYLFVINSVLIKLYKIDDRLITLFIDAEGKMIAWHSQKT